MLNLVFIALLTVTNQSRLKHQSLNIKIQEKLVYFALKDMNYQKIYHLLLIEITKKKCYHTGVDNYFIIELIDDKTGENIQYEIYFKLSRGGKKKGLNLYIQSAYSRDKEHRLFSKKNKKPIRFSILAHNTKFNKTIKVPK